MPLMRAGRGAAACVSSLVSILGFCFLWNAELSATPSFDAQRSFLPAEDAEGLRRIELFGLKIAALRASRDTDVQSCDMNRASAAHADLMRTWREFGKITLTPPVAALRLALRDIQTADDASYAAERQRCGNQRTGLQPDAATGREVDAAQALLMRSFGQENPANLGAIRSMFELFRSRPRPSAPQHQALSAASAGSARAPGAK
jgi:hypothetical protein